MNLTLHLTSSCNMDCSYCTQEKKPVKMTREVLNAACELAYSSGPHAGLCFFGGEPLLCEELIYDAMEHCAVLTEMTGKPAYYRMTTNGTLLTDKMIETAAKNRMEIGLSFDGLMQNICRRYSSGTESFDDVEAAAKRLLKAMPDSTAMMTIAPQAAGLYADSVKYLYSTGFRNIHAVPAYGHKVKWDSAALETMREQLRELSDHYCKCLLSGDPFYFSPFDTKIRCLISRTSPGDQCHLGKNQMPVAPEGKIYACNQFIGDENYCLGDVFSGISKRTCAELMIRHKLPDKCRECPLKMRCLNSCGCLNRLETGSESQVSEFHCAYERLLIHIADEAAETICQADRERFDSFFKQREQNF